MIYWAPFLHFYQPPIQLHGVLKKVCNESYRPLLKMLLEHPTAKVTINICGVLTEMLNDHGDIDVLDDIKQLADNKQLEFVDSAKYHAILPLIPQEEMKRQIKHNRKTNAYFFKDAYKPRGFFPPEMCYSDEVANLLVKMGYDWVIVGGVACPEEWPLDKIYRTSFDKSVLHLFYRDDVLSNRISFRDLDSSDFISNLVGLSENKKDIYVVTAMDAETFGHHIQNWEQLFLAEVYDMIDGISNYDDIKQRADLAEEHKKIFEMTPPQIQVVTMSELLDVFPAKPSKPPFASSWSTSKEDIAQGNYYPLWMGKGNQIHAFQWEHVKICFELMEKADKIKDDNEQTNRFYTIARGLLDRAIHSCQFWWANSFGRWDINLVNKGLMLQEEVVLNAYKAISVASVKDEIRREFYHKVIASRDVANKIRDRLILN